MTTTVATALDEIDRLDPEIAAFLHENPEARRRRVAGEQVTGGGQVRPAAGQLGGKPLRGVATRMPATVG
ncbi:hypothetical protein ABN034_27255 [Actinopolymorpha sp. B11F2]|uniref:hypothetical protein n=1 Tax=Actinopolymorpha sp. B11F2 TaxID=3160862 RepID=UPI0032E50752